MNVFDFAMKMEQDGKHFYEKLAAESSHIGLKNIFSRLAQDEEKHYQVFAGLKGQAQSSIMEDSRVLEDSRTIFEEIMGDREKILGSMQGDLEGYQYAMKLEAESVRLYEDAARCENNDELKSLLLRIADEEQKHFNIVENIYDFFNAPNEYLAWREFSNRGEFHQFGRDVDL
ncbi:MAG: ferritin family protein [Desulfuromonadales bacterium]